MYKIVCLARFTVVTIFFPQSCLLTETFQDELTSTQRSAGSAAWSLPNDYGLEFECADVLEHQLEVARQRVHDSQRTINKLRLDMHVLYAGVKKMKQDTKVTMKEMEILQTEICAI